MLYAIGDNKADTERQFESFSAYGDIIHLTFEELMSIEKIMDRNAGIILFFPYNLWNSRVETGNELYGVRGFKENIGRLKKLLCEKLEQVFPGAFYVNKPYVFALERDKIETKNFLELQHVVVTPSLHKDISTIMDELRRGNCVYIKVRYGSMGKGITRLEEGRWLTNFRYENDEIKNHLCDNEWRTIDVTDNHQFLEKLLREDVMVEKGIETLGELGCKFDIRGIFIYGRLAELYGRVSKNSMITNLSQGGDSLSINDLTDILGYDKLTRAVQEMYNANRALGTNLLGVDVTFDEKRNPYIIEVNSFPGLGHGIYEEDIRDALLRQVHSKLIYEYATKGIGN